MKQRPIVRNVGTTSRLRLRGYDYSQPSTYLITCTAIDREPLFGYVRNSGFRPSTLGEVILEEWERLEDAFQELMLDRCQLMPDHFHGMLTISFGDIPGQPTLSSIVGRFKSLTARRYWQVRDRGLCTNVGTTCWQDRFHDTIIRNDEHYDRVLMYISLNPRRWSQKYGV